MGAKYNSGRIFIGKDLLPQGQTDPALIASITADEKAKNPSGKDAVVRAKVDSDGKLGKIEILDGGIYDDSDAPLLLSFLPPKPILSDQDNVDLGDQIPVVGQAE